MLLFIESEDGLEKARSKVSMAGVRGCTETTLARQVFGSIHADGGLVERAAGR